MPFLYCYKYHIYNIYYFILHTHLWTPKPWKQTVLATKKKQVIYHKNTSKDIGFGRPMVYDQCGPSRAPIFPAGWIQIGCTIWSGQSRIAMGVSSRVCWPSLRIPRLEISNGGGWVWTCIGRSTGVLGSSKMPPLDWGVRIFWGWKFDLLAFIARDACDDSTGGSWGFI